MSRARDTADQINRINSSAADATAITVNSSENVGIGTDSPSSNYGFSKTVEIQGGVNAELSLSQTNNSKDWSFGVGNGNCYQQTNSGQTYSWYTGGVEKLRIQSGGGISFNGDTAAANALDDFETGTWTATLQNAPGGISNAGTAVHNKYTKVGNLVTISGYVELNTTSPNSGNAFIVDGLPFAPNVNNAIAGSMICRYGSTDVYSPYMGNNQRIEWYKINNTGNWNLMTYADLNGAFSVHFTVSYTA